MNIPTNLDDMDDVRLAALSARVLLDMVAQMTPEERKRYRQALDAVDAPLSSLMGAALGTPETSRPIDVNADSKAAQAAYGSPAEVAQRIEQYIARYGQEDTSTLLLYEAMKALRTPPPPWPCPNSMRTSLAFSGVRTSPASAWHNCCACRASRLADFDAGLARWDAEKPDFKKRDALAIQCNASKDIHERLRLLREIEPYDKALQDHISRTRKLDARQKTVDRMYRDIDREAA